VVRDTRNNVTAAIRHVIRPYILFKNDTDKNFPGSNGKLPINNIGYSISNKVISGLINAEHKLRKVTSKIANNTVTADVRTTFHKLDGKYDFKLDESKPIVGKATFTINRLDISISYNMLKPVDCTAEVVVNQPNIKYDTKLSPDIEKSFTNAFVDNIKYQFSTIICKGISQIVKPRK